VPRLAKIELATISATFTGSAAAVYPNLVWVAEEKWDWPVWVLGVQFSTSLSIFPTNLGGMVVTMGKTQKSGIAISPGLQSVIIHVTAPNSIAGPPAFAFPSSKVSHISFSDCGYYLDAQTPITIFAFADATAGNYLIAEASVQYRRAS
jgi:hypothetical protein